MYVARMPFEAWRCGVSCRTRNEPSVCFLGAHRAGWRLHDVQCAVRSAFTSVGRLSRCELTFLRSFLSRFFLSLNLSCSFLILYII